MTEPAEVVRHIVERCWTDAEAQRRRTVLFAPDYVHHTPSGDVGIDGLLAGLA